MNDDEKNEKRKACTKYKEGEKTLHRHGVEKGAFLYRWESAEKTTRGWAVLSAGHISKSLLKDRVGYKFLAC